MSVQSGRDAARIIQFIAIAALVFMIAMECRAQSVEICPSTSTKCVPPATWKSPGSKPPLDAPVRFGGEEIRNGDKYWRWIRNGDPSRPCTAAETAVANTTECKAQLGDLLFVNQRFRSDAVRTMALMAVVEEEQYGAYIITDHPRICVGTMIGTRCYGTAYKRPYSTFVALRVPVVEVFSPDGKIRVAPERCIAVMYDAAQRPFAEGEFRHDRTWVILPLYMDRSRTIAVKATPYASRNCGAITDPNIGEWILPPVQLGLLPSTTLEALR